MTVKGSDAEAAAAANRLSIATDMAQSGIPVTAGGVPSSLGLVRDLQVTATGNQPFVTEDTFDLVPTGPAGGGNTSTEGNGDTPVPAKKDDDSSSLTWLWAVIGVLGGCLLGGVAFVHMRKRKEAVNWNDIVVERERTADASMTGPVSYSKMGESKAVELDEMQPLQIVDSKTDELSTSEPNEEPLL